MAEKAKKGMRNTRGELIFELAGKEYALKPLMSVIDKAEQKYGSLFDMSAKFAGDEDKGRSYTLMELINALRILSNDTIDLEDDVMGQEILKAGMMRYDILVSTFLLDVAVTGTAEKGKQAGKLAS